MSEPGIGERATASGLRNQYGVGAALIIDTLREHDLEWIRVADPDAGRVDDIQIASTARLDAHQIKWSQYGGTLTLNNFAKDASPPLIAQLASGWDDLREEYSNRRVVVHLTTNRYASKSNLSSLATETLPEISDPPTPYHFAAFVEQAWRPAQRNGEIDYSGEWGAVWSLLLDSSGLDEDGFSQFVRDCKLDLRTPSPPEDEEHRALANFLFKTAAGPERVVELKRDDLLDQLGWTQRYEYRNIHEFEIPRFYQPIESTVDNLTDRLERLSSGYIAVVGSPGSGKSTLLTRTLRSLDFRLVRYYAYVPGAQDPTRGESISFLHDVTLRLDRAGFQGMNGRPEPSSRQELLEKLHGQLQALGENYKENDKAAVILVDGLDHIPREQHPERSLLKDLPHPDQIPEGVFFVLGSQTTNLDNLSPPVRREVEDSERRVEMGRLSPSDVDSIAREIVPELDEQDRHRLFDLSAGHPLALRYLVKPLQLAEDEEARSSILSQAVPYDDNIDDYYQSHWEQVKDDNDLVQVLGLLSRVRGAIPMNWADRWIERPTATKLERLFRRYFDVDVADRWSFFHNSFRLFLQERTAEPALGGSPDERERSFHAELAELYAESGSPWRWETIYHLYRAENHAAVVEQATAEWFQEQAKALRPMEAVQGDVELAIRSAGITQDPLALIRLTLIAATLEQQEYILEDYKFADRLLDIGDIPKALDHIRDGEALRVEDEHALRLSSRLAEMGMAREGGRVFQLAEPYDLFTDEPLTEGPGGAENPWGRLRSWIKAASRFESPDQVLDTVEQLQVEPESRKDQSSKEATANFQIWLVIQAVNACAERGAWSDWERYRSWIEEFDRGGLFTAILRSAEASLRTDPDRAHDLLQELLERFEPAPLDNQSPHRIRLRLDVADLILILKQDEETVAEWVGDLPPFPVQASNIPGEDSISQEDRFRRYRLEYWLGETKSPTELVRDEMENTEWGRFAKSEKKNGLRRLALIAVTLSALSGRGRREQRLEPSAFMREVEWVLDTLSRPYNDPPGLRLELSASRSETIDFLVRAASEHGEGVLETLGEEFEQRWRGGDWYNSLLRDAAVSLVKVGAESRARQLLEQLENETGKEKTPRDRAEEHWDQAEAWLAVQNTEKARVELQRMVVASRGILNEDDHQSEPWVQWMDRANELDPENAEERIRTMLRRLVAVSGEASGITDAASALVVAAGHWRPTRAAYLMKGLQEKGVLTHERAFSSLLLATLDAPNPPVNAVLHALTDLVVPLTGPRTKGLVESLIESVASRYGKHDAISAARYLVRRVRSEAISSDRSAWLERVKNGLESIDVSLSQVGIDPVELESQDKANNSSSNPDKLYLSDDRAFTPEEARNVVDSVSDFLELVEKEDSERTELFRWRDVAEKAVECVDSIEEISTLKETVTEKLDKRRAAKLLAQLSSRAREMGEVDKADSLAEEALAQSEPEGWDPWWGGGSRIEAIRSIQQANSERGRELAIEHYSEDITDSILSFKRLLLHLDEIADLLFDEVPTLEIWGLIEDYLDDLYEPVPVEPIPKIEEGISDSSTEASGLEGATAGVSVAIAEYLDHLSYVVGSRAAKVSAQVLLAGSETGEMQQVLEEMPGRSEAAEERLLTVLEAIVEEKPDLLSSFEETLRSLSESPNLTIRVRASKLLSRIEKAPVRVVRVQREVSGIYDLELPDISAHRTEEVVEGEDSPVVLDDPARSLRPFDTRSSPKSCVKGVLPDLHSSSN